MSTYGALTYGADTYGGSEEAGEEGWALLTQRITRAIVGTNP
jgi:hypothetical protein